MSRGIRGSRGWVGAGAALLLWATGCQWMPHQRVDPSLDPRRVGREDSRASRSPSAMALPVKGVSLAEAPVPETPLRAISDTEAMAAVAPGPGPAPLLLPTPATESEPLPLPSTTPKPASSPAPTPLLDAAVAQAQALQDVTTGVLPPDPLVSAPEPVSVPAVAAAAFPRDEAIVQTAAVSEVKASESVPAANLSAPAPVAASEPKPEPKPEPEPEPVAPEDQWRAKFEALRALARSREEASDGEPWPLRAAVLDWLSAEGPERADSRTVLWAALVESLARMAARAESEGAEPDEIPALREVIDTLEGQLPLRVGALALCRKVQGFGQYEPIAEPTCRAGQTVVLYCELEGLRYDPEPNAGENGPLRSRLESTVVVKAAEGDRVFWSQSLGMAEDVCRRRRRDYYVNYRLTLPDAATLPPGSYRLQIQQRDANAGSEAAAEVSLVIAEAAQG